MSVPPPSDSPSKGSRRVSWHSKLEEARSESSGSGDDDNPNSEEPSFGPNISIFTLAARRALQDDKDQSPSAHSKKLDVAEPVQDSQESTDIPHESTDTPPVVAPSAVAESGNASRFPNISIDVDAPPGEPPAETGATKADDKADVESKGSADSDSINQDDNVNAKMEETLDGSCEERPEHDDDAQQAKEMDEELDEYGNQPPRVSLEVSSSDGSEHMESSNVTPACELADATDIGRERASIQSDELDKRLSGITNFSPDDSPDDASSDGIPPYADSNVPEFSLRVESLARMGTPLLRTARPFFQRDPADKKARLTFTKMEGVRGGKLPTWSGNVRLPRGAQELVAWRRVWTMKEAAAQLAKLKLQHERLVTLSEAETQKRRKEVREVTEQLVNAKLEDASLDKLSSNVQCAAEALEEAQDRALIFSKFTSTQLSKSQQEARSFKDALADIGDADGDPGWVGRFCYCSDLGWEPQCTRFCEILLERNSWRPYPRQSSNKESTDIGYQGRSAGRFKGSRPMGGAIVDFADDPLHALTAMTIQGRQWLVQKHNLAMLFPDADWSPQSYFINDGVWQGRVPTGNESTCWFMKSGGSRSEHGVKVLASPAECLELAISTQQAYIVQPHIDQPMLLGDKKFHLKMFMCPICRAAQQGAVPVWEVWVAKEGYICEANEAWSESQLTPESQTTSNQTKPASYWSGFDQTWPKCIAIITSLLKRLVKRQHLRSVERRATFEMFAVDFLVDTHWKVWLLGCNSYSSHDGNRFDDTCMVRDLLNLAVPESRGDSLFSLLRRSEQFQSWEFITCIEEPPAPKEKISFSAALAHLYRP